MQDKFINKRFGRLKVIDYAIGPFKRKGKHYMCLCDCSNYKIVHQAELSRGDTESCGCLKKEQLAAMSYRHGYRKHPIYKAYYCMKNRCYNTNNKDYDLYGARGITVCDEWLASFNNFLEDMLSTWNKGLSIERLDCNKGYYKENCVWATPKQQANNRRSSVRVIVDNTLYTKEEYCKLFNVKRRTLDYRLAHNKLQKEYLYN